MHDSFTALDGLIPLFNIQLGEVVIGGVKNAKTTARRTPKQRAAARRNIRKAQTSRRRAA